MMAFEQHAEHCFQRATGKGRELDVCVFGLVEYQAAFAAMRAFANSPNASAKDRIWLLQHPAVYTQGTACRMQTLLPSEIPLVKTDRGGQITYHGPGQWVMYPLLNLREHGLGVKKLVASLEQSVIDLLLDHRITGERRQDAPGVYVAGEKIAALGLRIRNGRSYHGLSLNTSMDLSPFLNIDPCGFQGLKTTQLANFIPLDDDQALRVGQDLVAHFLALI